MVIFRHSYSKIRCEEPARRFQAPVARTITGIVAVALLVIPNARYMVRTSYESSSWYTTHRTTAESSVTNTRSTDRTPIEHASTALGIAGLLAYFAWPRRPLREPQLNTYK